MAAVPSGPVEKPVVMEANEDDTGRSKKIQINHGESSFTTVQHKKRRRQPSISGAKAKAMREPRPGSGYMEVAQNLAQRTKISRVT